MAIPKFVLRPEYAPKDGDYLLLPYVDAKKACFSPSRLPKAVREAAQAPKEPGEARTVFSGPIGRASAQARTVRLDARDSCPAAEAKKMVAAALASAKKEAIQRVVVFIDAPHQELVLATQEGALLGGYVYDRYLSDKAKPVPVMLVSGPKGVPKLRRALADRATLHACVNLARDVLNGPPNIITPPRLAREFRTMGRASGLRVTVWDEKRLARERCGGVIGVGQGAKAKPRLVIGEYRPRRALKHIALVGKGVTFDSGGYCLKPSSSQVGMKYDMGGAAMMFAAACAIARLRLPIRVTVVTPLAENAISGEAYHTTSILTTRSGRTVEVHNTDAEGRLILSDALALAAERKPDWIVDAATLTGACVVALGEDITGVYGTDPTFTKCLIDAGAREGELFWEMPLHRPYAEQIKTTVADCKNTGGKWGGSITAALFLKQWVPDGVPWIHCDIAGPGCKEEPLGHLGKGAKGFGVKTVVALAHTLAGKS